MNVVQIPFERNEKISSKKWTTVYIKIDGGKVECGFGGDVASDSKPPNIRISDGKIIYNIQYFVDVVDAYIWLIDLKKSLEKENN